MRVCLVEQCFHMGLSHVNLLNMYVLDWDNCIYNIYIYQTWGQMYLYLKVFKYFF